MIMNYHLAQPNRLLGPLSGYLRRASFLNTQPTRALRKFIHGSPPRSLPIPPHPHLPFAPREPGLKTVFLLLGLCFAGYLAYDLWSDLRLWPLEVRHYLRSGLTSEYNGDLEASELYFQLAWTTAKSLPISLFDSEPYLKISGIAVRLASVLEKNHKMERAFRVYEEALAEQPEEWESLSGKAKLRSIGIAYKLGEMAGEMEGMEEMEEFYLTLAVGMSLGIKKHDNDNGEINDLGLPDWATKVDFAAPSEMLAGFYARQGRIEDAMVLYIRAINILIPSSPAPSSAEDYCRAAQLMTALSDLTMRNPDSKPVSQKLNEAELWSQVALNISMHFSSASVISQNPTCQATLAAAAYNIGILKKMTGDKRSAKSHFEQSLKVSKLIGMQEGIQNAEEAFRTIDEEMAQE